MMQLGRTVHKPRFIQHALIRAIADYVELVFQRLLDWLWMCCSSVHTNPGKGLQNLLQILQLQAVSSLRLSLLT